MKKEKSCGAVVFTRDGGKIQYVIIKSTEGIFGFPKGHVENDETETQTALREIFEEVGLTVELIDGFREETSHTFARNDVQIMKQVVYFLGEFSSQTPVRLESELDGVYLMDYDEAMASFQFENSKQILTAAHKYLNGKNM